MPLPGPPCCPAHKAVTRPSLPEQRSGLAKVTWPAQCLSPPPFRPEAVSSWRSWGCSRRGSPQRGPLFLPPSGSAAGSCLFRISYISSPSSLSNGHHRPWSPMVTKGDVGVPTGLGPFPVPLGGALLSALGPSRHLGWLTGLSGGWGLRLALGTQAAQAASRAGAGLTVPISAAYLTCLFLCLIHSLRPRTKRSASRKAKGGTCR